MKSVSSSLFFNFQYGHWRKSRGPRSCRPTTPLQTAACTPTPRAALYRPSTAVPTRARSLSRRNSVPGRSTARRTAKRRILGPLHKVLLWGEGESQQWPVSCCILCTSIAPDHLDQSLSVNVNPRFHAWRNLRQVYKSEGRLLREEHSWLVFTLPPSPTRFVHLASWHTQQQTMILNPKWGSFAT